MSDPTKAPPSARRAALGFNGGGQVLSLRLQDAELEELRKALQDKQRRLARGRGHRRRRPRRPRRRSPTCASSPASTASGSRCCTSCASPQRARPRPLPARPLARPHAARPCAGCGATRSWVSTGRCGSGSALAGAAVDRARRPRWLRATGTVGRGLRDLDLDQGRDRPPPPGRRGPAAPDGTPTGLSFPSSHSTSSFAAAQRVRAAAAARAAVRGGGRDGVLAAVPRRALPVRRRRRRGARHRAGERWADDEGRHRRDAQRGQVVAVQRALARRRRGRQLPVHDDRAERGGRPGARRAARRGGEDGRRVEHRPGHDRVPRHRRARRRARTRARGSATSSSPTSARPTRCCTSSVRTTTTNVIHPEGRVDPAADIDTIETELVYADLEQAERRHARVVREARGGDRAAIAEEEWLGARDRRAAGGRGRPAPCRSRTRRRTRCATSRR